MKPYHVITAVTAVILLGLAVLLYVAGDMFHRGIVDPTTGLLTMLGGGLS